MCKEISFGLQMSGQSTFSSLSTLLQYIISTRHITSFGERDQIFNHNTDTKENLHAAALDSQGFIMEVANYIVLYHTKIINF